MPTASRSASALADPSAFGSLAAGRAFTFSPESKYLAISTGDEQERVLRQYEKMSGIPAYYLLYNPATIPLQATVPATKLAPQKVPRVGCRIVPAEVLIGSLRSKGEGYHPKFSDVAGLAAPFTGKHLAGWRLEHFVADLLASCREGHVATGETDHVLETLFYRRSGPIAAAIAITVNAPPDTELVLPEVTPPSWKRDEI